MVRHHLRQPGDRAFGPVEISLGREGFVVIQFVEHGRSCTSVCSSIGSHTKPGMLIRSGKCSCECQSPNSERCWGGCSTTWRRQPYPKVTLLASQFVDRGRPGSSCGARRRDHDLGPAQRTARPAFGVDGLRQCGREDLDTDHDVGRHLLHQPYEIEATFTQETALLASGMDATLGRRRPLSGPVAADECSRSTGIFQKILELSPPIYRNAMHRPGCRPPATRPCPRCAPPL